jgi:hypothetical protein
MSRISLLIPVLVLAACSSTPKGSGFLDADILAKMKPTANAGSKMWIKPGADLRAYDRLLIKPIVIVDGSVEGGAGEDAKLTEEQKEKVRVEFRKILVDEVNPYYPVVEEPGDHVLVVRIALTKFTPIEAGVSAGAASLEVDMRDARTDEVLCAATSTVTGSTKDRGIADDPKWAAVEGAFFEWAERLLDFMDSHHEQP